MIKQAEEHDILVIEEILLDSVMWMEKNKLQNQWNENEGFIYAGKKKSKIIMIWQYMYDIYRILLDYKFQFGVVICL